MNFYKKVIDVNALKLILVNGGKVSNFPRLHAKFYIFDDCKAIISSANLTKSGLQGNYEYGVVTDDSDLVRTVVTDFENLQQDEISGNIDLSHIDQISSILNDIPPLPEVRIPSLHLEYENQDELFNEDTRKIVNNLSGWKKAVFSAIRRIDKPISSTSDYVELIPLLENQYPDNHFIEAKIRQQLQELRDIGLIKFEGNGIYKKLWIENS